MLSTCCAPLLIGCGHQNGSHPPSYQTEILQRDAVLGGRFCMVTSNPSSHSAFLAASLSSGAVLLDMATSLASISAAHNAAPTVFAD